MKFNYKYKFIRIACSLLALLLCMGVYAPILATSGEDVQSGVVCTLTPRKGSYETGETIQFTLNAQYAEAGTGGAAPDVKIGIPIPDTTPELQLPMFSKSGSGEYSGVPMCTLDFSGISTELYLVTLGNGSRRIEFTLTPGDTIQGVLSMFLPNGISEPIPELQLTPELLSPYDPASLKGATTQVLADFGWNDVKKAGSTDNLGVISANTNDPDHIEYTITADSLSSGIDSGRVYTDHYVLSDTLRLNGLHYIDGTLTSAELNGITEYYIAGKKVLEIDKPKSSLTVEKAVSESTITGFSISYTANNNTLHKTDGSAQELENLNVHAKLMLEEMKLNPGNSDTSVVNTAVFDAYSPFGDHVQSTASHTAYTQDRYKIEKEVYSDVACTIPATQVSHNDYVWYKIDATNLSADDGPFTITDELPAGMRFVSATPAAPTSSGQTLTWSNVTIPSGETRTIIVRARFDSAKFASNPLHNTAVLSKGEQRLVSDFADVRYLAGMIDDASIIYEKTVNKTSAGFQDNLRYTITARNEQANSPAKRSTITDKWPGANVLPTAITGCTDYELFDINNVSYTLEEVKNAAVEITTIKLYNVLVPKGGGKATVYIDGVVTHPILELKNELVGVSGQNLVSTTSLGVGITKAAYEYDDATGIGDMLTNTDIVVANQLVCYQMTVRNLTDIALNNLALTDKLPIGLTPVTGSVSGVNGKVIIRHGTGYSSIDLTQDPATPEYIPCTTGVFSLDSKETATIYFFVQVSAEAVAASNASTNCITNAAYVNLPGGLVTGDATSNIYTYVDTTQAFCIKKSIAFIADYDEDLTTATTPLIGRVNNLSQWNKNDIIWNGAYIGYRIDPINRNATGANTDPVLVYEFIDRLPTGMEFVGVCVEGNSGSYSGGSPSLKNIGSKLIRDGETGTWTNSVYGDQEITCDYDAIANKVHITFNKSGDGVLPVRYYDGVSTTNKNLIPYIYLLARVKEDAGQASYQNFVDAKVKDTVTLNKQPSSTASDLDGDGANAGYRFITNYCSVSPIVFKPGIDKDLIGHYFPQGNTTPATVRNEDSLFPGETLRFRLQVGGGVVSGAGANREHANIQNFTVTDILPAEYVYRPGSATVTFNAQINTNNMVLDETSPYATMRERGTIEPSIELLSDGRTKLTWDFNSPDMRIKSSIPNFSYNYFVHLITYDTDWNTAYPSTYGNYTNVSTVTHSIDFTSVYSGVPDYAQNSITATEVVNVFGTSGTVALKSITSSHGVTTDGNQTGNGANTVSVTDVGDVVHYTLSVKNSAEKSEMKSVIIIDELPRESNDTGVVNRKDRGSEFNIAFGDTPNVSVYLANADGSVKIPIDKSQYTVMFGTSTGRLNSNGDWGTSPADGRIVWGGESDGKDAIRIAFLPEHVFNSRETILVYFDAVVKDGADPGEIAWNSFGYTYRSVNLNDNTLSSKIYAEPLKVGAYVPSAQLNVTKTVIGDSAPSGTEFNFVLKKGDVAQADVKYIVNGGTEAFRTGSDGSFKLKDGDTATLYVGAGIYTVNEAQTPDHYAFVSAVPAYTNDGIAQPGQAFTFKELAVEQSAGVVFTNSFEMPEFIDLSVKKVWKGEVDPAQPVEVKVQLYKNGVAEGNPVTLSVANNWGKTWNGLDNLNFVWTVKEVTPLPVGYVSTVTGDQLTGYTITNTYANPNTSIQVVKAWTGDTDLNQPAEVQVQLYRNNVKYEEPVILNEQNQWKHIWPSMDRSYTWTVREVSPLPAGYTSAITGSVITGFTITNRYTAPGELTVKKTVTGGGNTDALFTFRFTFSRPESYPYSGDKSGMIATGGSVQLKHGQSITVKLPKGVTYTVVEDAVSQYVPTPADRTYTGTIGDTVSLAEFTNKYDAPYVPPVESLTGSLTLQKNVTGDLGDATMEFPFTVTFNAGGSYYYTGSKNGMISSGDTVYLRHGEFINIVNLPAGTAYSVAEGANRGYKTYASGDTGIILSNGIVKAAFTNSKSSVPRTGDDNTIQAGVLVMISASVGIILLTVMYRKVSRRKKRSTAAQKPR